MAFSAWKIWLHPHVAGHAMADLEQTVAEHATEVAKTREAEACLRFEHEALVESNDTLARRNEELEAEVERLRDELADTRAELNERVETEQQIREFETKLSRFDNIKTQYEKRINRLRAKILEMKKASGEESPEADEIAVIDMRTQPMPKRLEQEVEENPEEDWLETLDR